VFRTVQWTPLKDAEQEDKALSACDGMSWCSRLSSVANGSLVQSDTDTGRKVGQSNRSYVLELPSSGAVIQDDRDGLAVRVPDFDLVLSASKLALLGQRRGQRSALFYLHLP
jgi:hypothetical protein